MLKESYLQFFFLSLYIFIGLVPRFGAIDFANTQWLSLSLISFFHSLYNYKRLININFGWIPLLLLLFNVFIFLSGISAKNFPEFFIESSKVLILTVVFFNCYIAFSKDKFLIRALFFLVAAMLLIEVFSVLKIFRANYYASIVEKVGRSAVYRGIAGNINIAAYSMVFKSIAVLYFINNTKKNIFKVLGVLFLIPTFFAISLTGSRGALLSIYVVIFLYFMINLYQYNKTKNIRHILSTFFYVIPFSISFIITELVFDTLRTSYRTAQIFQRGSASRLQYWIDAINATMDHPFFGVGFGNWKIFSMYYNKDYMRDYVVPYHAHNDFLQIFAEIGILGGLIFLLIFFFSFYIIIINFIKEKKGENNILKFLFLSIIVYAIDSSLNFPISRPLVVVTFFVILASVASYDNSQIIRKKNYLRSFLPILFILGSSTSLLIQKRSYNSAVQQVNLYVDYNKGSFDDPVEEIDLYEEDFPNVTQTAMPIKAIKAHYYAQSNRIDEAIDILKTGPKKFDNPFIGIYEAKLANIYNDLEQYDSAFKYATIAYDKLSNNLYHAGHLIKSASELKKFDIVKKVFDKNRKYNEEGIWYFFLRTMYANSVESEIDIDSLRQISIKARNLFPQNDQIKIIFQDLIYGYEKLQQAEDYFNKGSDLYSIGDYEGSFNEYQKASNLIPTEYAYRQNMALAKISSQDFDVALDILNYTIDSLTVPDENARIYILRGGIMVLKGLAFDACLDFITALEKKDKLAEKLILENCSQFSSQYNPDL